MLKQSIRDQMTRALKSQEKDKLTVLRFILSLINYAEIEKKADLTDEEIIFLLQKEVKKRQEAIQMFREGGRTENIADEEKQIDVIQTFLPEQMSPDELKKIIEDVVRGAPPGTQMGQVIGLVMAKVKGRAKGSDVASQVKAMISPKG